jgi:hypothetical protein
MQIIGMLADPRAMGVEVGLLAYFAQPGAIGGIVLGPEGMERFVHAGLAGVAYFFYNKMLQEMNVATA